MSNKKILALVATAALAACLALVGCGGSQAASSSAASSSEASSPAASEPAASESAAASSAEASASSAEASASAEAPSEPAAVASASAPAADSYIGEDAAKAAALADAGLAEGDVTELEAELDLDDAVVHYDVDFKSGGMEYDYDIDAATGDILSSNAEVDD